jgi:hypothetical protein
LVATISWIALLPPSVAGTEVTTRVLPWTQYESVLTEPPEVVVKVSPDVV